MNLLRFWQLPVILACMSIGCSDLGDPYQPGATTGVSFENDLQPIFNANCIVCHGSQTPVPAHLDLRAGVSYANLVGRVSFGYPPVLRVTPSDTLASVLYGKIKGVRFGEQMPPGFRLLPEAQRDLIITWILEGARQN